MLNHARTLLVNVSGAKGFQGLPGEELIDADFLPVRLTGGAKTVWETIFGPDPDYWMRNYRVRELLTCIHLPELEEIALSLDSRVSYQLSESNPFYNPALYLPYFSFMSHTSPPAYLSGDPGPHDSAGRLERKWIVRTVSSGTVVEATLQNPLAQSSTGLSFTDGLSNEIPLPGSGLRFRLGGDPGAPEKTWEVTSVVRPNRSLTKVASDLRQVGDSTLADVFRTATPAGQAEPLVSLRNMWNDHPLLCYQIGAIALALVLRMESLRE